MSLAADGVDNLVAALDDELQADTPALTLQRWFAQTVCQGNEQQNRFPNRDSQQFRVIGRGSCGLIFETCVDKVLKMAVRGNLSENLYQDFRVGSLVWEQFSALRILWNGDDILPRTPKYFSFLDSEHSEFQTWWKTNQNSFSNEHQDYPQTSITEERIPPLPKRVREALIDEFCIPEYVQTQKDSPFNTDCLARLYLGRNRRHYNRRGFFTLRNIQIHLNDAKRIILEADIERYVTQMANALAVMHYLCEVDGHDVEFVLGSAPTRVGFEGAVTSRVLQILPKKPFFYDAEMSYQYSRKRPIQLWCLDFDKARYMTLDHAGIEQAIQAAMVNDPYYPSPVPEHVEDQGLWDLFAERYATTAKFIISLRQLTDCEELPAAFLNGWEDAVRTKRKRDSEMDNEQKG